MKKKKLESKRLLSGQKKITNKQERKKMEDKHIQFFLNGKDYDLILRVDDEGEEYTSFDIFDYEKQETVVTEKI